MAHCESGQVLGAKGVANGWRVEELFFSAIEQLPLERQGAALRWLKERVVLAKVAEQLIADAGAELPPELQEV
jgi:transcriptional regulator of acetoin/glycerol metabolism